jgi:hypothetical protein
MKVKLKERLHYIFYKEPYGTDAVIHINDIIIPREFLKLKSKPAYWKMVRARRFYVDHGYVDIPVSVSPIINERNKTKYILVDGYTRYLVLKEVGMKEIPIRYQY